MHAQPAARINTYPLAVPAAERPLRIVHVDTGKHWRGSQHQIIYTMEGQICRGHDACLICRSGTPLAEHAADRGLEVVQKPMTGGLDPIAILKLTRTFRQLRPDVVHLQSSHAHVLGGVAARAVGVPAIILSRRLDNPIDTRIRQWKYRHFYNAIISVSEGVRNVLTDAGVRPEQVFVVHSAVPDSFRRYRGNGGRIRQEFGLHSSHQVITALAHIEYRKGIDTLVDAMGIVLRQVPEARALVVGAGSYRRVIERKVMDMNLAGRVILPGFRSDVHDILAASDVVVSPSYLEGCCNALLEAMAAGKPVVGTEVGGTPEIIEHWRNGLLVPPKDPDALAWALVRTITDEELAADFGNEGRRIVRERFSVDRMVDQTLEVYYRVLERGPRPSC